MYQEFSIENSINQQKIYLQLAEELPKNRINVTKLAMDHFEEAYEEIKKILNISGKEE